MVSHAGVLPHPEVLVEVEHTGTTEKAAFDAVLDEAVSEVVHHQVDLGIDVVNDGELAKRGGFAGYIRSRMSGIVQHAPHAGFEPRRVNARDQRMFPGFYAAGRGGARNATGQPNPAENPHYAVEPLKYTGHEAVAEDIRRLKEAAAGQDVELYIPGVAPGTMEHWLWNEYYSTDEEFMFAIADVLHEEFKAITDAGIIVQIDDPDLPDGWQIYPDMTLEEYRIYARLRVEAINHSIRGLPEELIRFHICWGSQHGPHADDIPLREVVDLALEVKAQCLSVEAANPTHEHEWTVWEDVKLKDGHFLMPGVVGHATDLIEHPELVAQRLVRYAELVGKENVIAGTDCGLGSRVGHGEICWAKLDSLSKGAAIASSILWK